MPQKEYISKNYALYLVNYFGNMQTWSKEDVVSEIKRKIVEADVELPVTDVSPIRHGRWLYEVHKENVNFRWNVTAKCSECCDNRKEIWGGFFPNVPDCIARDVALQNAKQIKLDNYCPNCGVKMNKED